MRGLVVKELHELAREKRFTAFMTTLALVLGIGGALMLREIPQMNAYGWPMGFKEPVLAFLFVGLVSSVLLALTFAADAVAKEHDQGMLPLLLTAPVTHLEVYLSKFTALVFVYGCYAALNLTVAALMSLVFGFVVVKTAFWLLAGPLAAFFLFLAGLGLCLSTLFRTSKAALATSVGVIFPMFLLIKFGPVGFLLRQTKPRLYDALGWLPAEASLHAAMQLAEGHGFSWLPLLTTALTGLALATLGYFNFRSREVAA